MVYIPNNFHELIIVVINFGILVVMVHSTLLDINDAESCDLLCKQCNVSAIIANDRCECNFSNNNDKGIINDFFPYER